MPALNNATREGRLHFPDWFSDNIDQYLGGLKRAGFKIGSMDSKNAGQPTITDSPEIAQEIRQIAIDLVNKINKTPGNSLRFEVDAPESLRNYNIRSEADREIIKKYKGMLEELVHSALDKADKRGFAFHGGEKFHLDNGKFIIQVGRYGKGSTSTPSGAANITCPNCNGTMTVPTSYSGQRMKCPLCHTDFTVPDLSKARPPRGRATPAPTQSPPPADRNGPLTPAFDTMGQDVPPQPAWKPKPSKRPTKLSKPLPSELL
jgi:hypothetical protein